MQNVLKRKNMYLEGFKVILNFFPQPYFLYHSESIGYAYRKMIK